LNTWSSLVAEAAAMHTLEVAVAEVLEPMCLALRLEQTHRQSQRFQ
jgi:hypothetical protein